MWYAKLKAFSTHFVITALVAGIVSYLVFKQWFPAPFAKMMDAGSLLILVLTCDLLLGPLVSFVIYSPQKKMKSLLSDYAVVISIQIAALAYGMSTVVDLRPVFLVFTADRYVVVSAGELTKQEIKQGTSPEFPKASFGGYRTVYVERISDPEKQMALIMSSLDGGRDLQHVVENYHPVSAHVPDVLAHAKTLAELEEKFPSIGEELSRELLSIERDKNDLLWLPVQAQKAFWTALVDKKTALPVGWLELDPL
ncbi:TfpX/TfpZ family type IV pilin accessory protein [uncultured Zhongshania sp.]|uniref:TfpX/TfpZ family type IV pilin accessory protein n=1 Tax=uncultured Zhongshania sp. TaxID=1642288 RepID=UPI0030DCAB14